ncbi:MAG: hypothetical protein GX053_00825 [Tissierella sp.]|nr:hypothetical protein [Tissierella sp.]
MLIKRIFRILKNHFQNYFLYYFILSLGLILGIIIGSLLINSFSFNTKLFILKVSNPYYKVALLSDNLNHSIMRASILSNIYLILLIYLISVLNIGLFIMPFILLIKGMLLGFTVGFLVNSFGLKGFLLSIGGIYPQNIFIISGLIGLGAVTMSLSKMVRRPLANPMLQHGSRKSNESLLLTAIYSFIIIFGAIIEGIISHRFLSFTLDFFV